MNRMKQHGTQVKDQERKGENGQVAALFAKDKCPRDKWFEDMFGAAAPPLGCPLSLRDWVCRTARTQAPTYCR